MTIVLPLLLTLEDSPGYTSLAQANAAGADMTLADRRWLALTWKDMYAASTDPAIVAKPDVITAWISDLVMSCARKSFIWWWGSLPTNFF